MTSGEKADLKKAVNGGEVFEYFFLINTNPRDMVTHNHGGIHIKINPLHMTPPHKSLEGLVLKCPEDKEHHFTQVCRIVTPFSCLHHSCMNLDSHWAPPPPHLLLPPTSLRSREAWHDFGPDPGPYLDVLFWACGDQMFLVITPPPIRAPVSSK